ncbi:MAG: DMT family transporter [Solobacterium sp.]|nr:DMT family transporter [Solobacterium sp.]
MKDRNKLRGSLILLGTALIWGCAFAFQSMASETIGPWLFNGSRFLLGGIEIMILTPVLEKLTGEAPDGNTEGLYKAGILAGLVLLGASLLQQAGIHYTTAGKAGFITSLYVVMVPVAGVLFLNQKVSRPVVIAVCLAIVALYLLSKPEAGSLNKGDVLEFLCAMAFTVHLYVLGHFAGKVPAIRFSAIQFLTAGLIGLFGAFLFETVSLEGLKAAAIPVLYAGLASAGLGYTLQLLGQRDADPAVASVILSLESVFSVLFGFLLLHEVLSARELIGCALMFAAVLISQKEDTAETG